MANLISRFSSRNQRLSHVFLKDRLKGAETYDRIAGYFRSSIFDLIHEEISTIGRVRIVCNADLDPRDLTAATLSQKARDQAQVERWHDQENEIDALLERPRWRRLHELLTAGNVEIRVVSRDNAPFLHGKAGVITRPDGTTSSFIGSINETANGWAQSYEMIWEDPSPEAAAWIRSEFDWLWKKGVPLSQAVIDEIGRTANKVEVQIEAMRTDPVELAKSVTVESPLVRRGEGLAPWQKAFVKIFVEHDQKYGAARLLLADEVGVGKTLSMAATGALTVLLGHGPFLILCPATLTLQWQMELWDKLGLPACVWARAPQRGWVDHRGHLYRSRDPEDVLRCPAQIGIVSTGLLVRGGPEAQALMRGTFGMIALDEGHKARVKRGIGTEEPEPGKLYQAMERLAGRTRHLVIGTATPIQTHREEIWDLMKLLAYGQDHVLGRPSVSRWWDSEQALDLVSGRTALPDPEVAWPWLRSPLPHAREAAVFRGIREDLKVSENEFFTDRGLADLDDFTREDLTEVIERGEIARRLPFMRYHNPLGRHVVLRRRKTLEEAGLMDRIAVNIHPRPGTSPAVFERSAVRTPHFYDRAYEEIQLFTRAMKARQAGTGFLGNLMMQRICSSVASGIATATKMLERRREGIMAEEAEDPDLLEAIEEMGADAYAAAVDVEAIHLERVLEILSSAKQEDPKGRAVLHYLDQEGWIALGCIIFSQYYDTARWVGELISATHPTEPVAVYAGVGKSGILLGGEWRSIDREEIKRGVKERKLRVVCATDAACEGLNLQTLGTLINVDLPWNPSRLEQRIGRIKRYGQQRREVDMANLVYSGTIDERVYQRLSERMQDRYDILGSLPDTIEDDWIENIERLEEELKSFTKPESPADVFSLRYGDFLEVGDGDADWELWTKVVSRRDIETLLELPWSSGR
ncbi:phospholipase D-like domain-containing anti-phage protein [Sphingopyxis sp. H115]|uniref:phospholipase D-like domain-containing anti-phage protein n=1 Tax=Sphingopyxis sp. H115 TaxID=1759073 RepID=UPI00073732B5|nr:phospholipase D-like domain-containing anti-phage protein [Sphingopyxis sp. H115]KTE05257.1 DEAD/DEAH box helicase [Sphingopyxis sp. H115]